MYSILIVDDNSDTRTNIRELFEQQNFQTLLAGDGCSAVDILRKHHPDALILDMKIPGITGWEVLRQIKSEIDAGLVVVIITAFGEISMAVEAVKQGVYDFIEKPFNNDRLLLSIAQGLKNRKLEQELEQLKRDQFVSADDFGNSKKIQKVLAEADTVADTDMSVLISGPTGSGKNLLAKYIHQKSSRCQYPFVEVDCGSISESLITSELFGSEKGSYTGSTDHKTGKIRTADGGTLVLDEIGNIPYNYQRNFLRAVEEKKISPVGSEEEFEVDFRLIVATLQRLDREVQEGHFRDDLYYRITQFVIDIPPLKSRSEDIPHLAQKFLMRYNEHLNKNITAISDDALDKLMNYRWPGNVRELQNVINTAVLYAKDFIRPDHIIFKGVSIYEKPSERIDPKAFSPDRPMRQILKEKFRTIEKEYVLKALEMAENNITKAAQLYGIERSNFYQKLSKYGIKV